MNTSVQVGQQGYRCHLNPWSYNASPKPSSEGNVNKYVFKKLTYASNIMQKVR